MVKIFVNNKHFQEIPLENVENLNKYVAELTVLFV